MIIIQNKISSFLLGEHYAAMCFLPFLFVNNGYDVNKMPVFLNHERIHARQQTEMLWLFFFLWYVAEYLVRLFFYRSHRKAYMNLSQEREARYNAGDLNYLKTRRPFAWVKYISDQAKREIE